MKCPLCDFHLMSAVNGTTHRCPQCLEKFKTVDIGGEPALVRVKFLEEMNHDATFPTAS